MKMLTETIAKVKYKGYSMVFQEVPNEISLVINICGCPHHCVGCHSEYLWSDKDGKILYDDFDNLISDYGDYITCICFMGGDWVEDGLRYFLKKAKEKGFKTCLYTALELSDLKVDLMRFLDYVKVGPYIESLGGLKSSKTNQSFYSVKPVNDNDFLLQRVFFVEPENGNNELFSFIKGDSNEN